MSPSLRFLGLVVIGWIGLRSAMVGRFPAAALLETAPSEARPLPPIAQTDFASLAPPDPMQAAAAYATDGAPVPQPTAVRPAISPVYYYGVGSVRAPLGPAQARYAAEAVYYGEQSVRVPLSPARATGERPLIDLMPTPQPAVDPGYPSAEPFTMSHLASLAMAQHSSVVITPGQSVPALPANKTDRLQLTMWAFLRSPQTSFVTPSPSLATGGMLGGSQAGARLFYNFTRNIAAVLRVSSDVGRRGGEAALGIRVHPLQSIPIWITAERRQAIGKYGNGRSDFAAFAEGGVYDRPLAGGFVLDGYAQAGVVGIRRRDMFADGALTVTRPVYKKFSAGVGIWGGAQPGLYRVDVGPRVTMRVRNNVRVHFDYRQKVAGNALPGSGPTVTLAGDF